MVTVPSGLSTIKTAQPLSVPTWGHSLKGGEAVGDAGGAQGVDAEALPTSIGSVRAVPEASAMARPTRRRTRARPAPEIFRIVRDNIPVRPPRGCPRGGPLWRWREGPLSATKVNFTSGRPGQTAPQRRRT